MFSQVPQSTKAELGSLPEQDSQDFTPLAHVTEDLILQTSLATLRNIGGHVCRKIKAFCGHEKPICRPARPLLPPPRHAEHGNRGRPAAQEHPEFFDQRDSVTPRSIFQGFGMVEPLVEEGI